VPSPTTMLHAYQDQLRKSRGHGQPGLAEVARLTKVVGALLRLLNEDMDRGRTV
jgi:hypothetical protein